MSPPNVFVLSACSVLLDPGHASSVVMMGRDSSSLIEATDGGLMAVGPVEVLEVAYRLDPMITMAIVNTCTHRDRYRRGHMYKVVQSRVDGQAPRRSSGIVWYLDDGRNECRTYLPGQHGLSEDQPLDEDAQADGQRAQDQPEHDAAARDREGHQHALPFHTPHHGE